MELGHDKSGGLVLERCAIEPLERGWITDGNIEKFDEVAEALRRLVKKSGTRTKNVALALPPSAVITKKITLPGGDDGAGTRGASRVGGQSIHSIFAG